MSTWSYLSKHTGYRTSPNFYISLDGDGALTTFDWDATIPIGTSISFQTNCSFDGGVTWVGWKDIVKGGSIPDMDTNVTVTNLVVQYRTTMISNDAAITPELKSVTMIFTPVIEIDNNGDVDLFPEIWITKKGNGDVAIINASNRNDLFKFTGLLDGETVYVNGTKEYIESSLALVYRYDSFNDNYLQLPIGRNVLQISGNCDLKFRYQLKTLQG